METSFFSPLGLPYRISLPQITNKTARAVVGALVHLGRRKLEVWASDRAIAHELGCSRRTVQRALRWLEREGWILRNVIDQGQSRLIQLLHQARGALPKAVRGNRKGSKNFARPYDKNGTGGTSKVSHPSPIGEDTQEKTRTPSAGVVVGTPPPAGEGGDAEPLTPARIAEFLAAAHAAHAAAHAQPAAQEAATATPADQQAQETLSEHRKRLEAARRELEEFCRARKPACPTAPEAASSSPSRARGWFRKILNRRE